MQSARQHETIQRAIRGDVSSHAAGFDHYTIRFSRVHVERVHTHHREEGLMEKLVEVKAQVQRGEHIPREVGDAAACYVGTHVYEYTDSALFPRRIAEAPARCSGKRKVWRRRGRCRGRHRRLR